ncbi:MAG: type II and III secretion system family protein [Alphaproteobacteria bacterium CG_4_9_14_3_um_filter_47_13]|nr:MAG: type II and III secretion system family protein [Alphaproteobacteria bacterium CG_4_9_14_3_um_filter_47_13]
MKVNWQWQVKTVIFRNLSLLFAVLFILQGCADATVPGARNVNIPAPMMADARPRAINEQPDSVLYLPLGHDVLVPFVNNGEGLPTEHVGPFELRSETLAGALQLILAEYDLSLAFETEEGLNRRITVANLQGPLDVVVGRVCSLADLYCAYEEGLLIVKETQTFTVKIPPISQDVNFISNVAAGLAAIIGTTPVIDQSTKTIIYEATNRTAEYALRYFQRMRTSTALIVFETYIWEVNLETGNSTGVRWDMIETFGKFTGSIDLTGNVGAGFTNPVSIGLPTTGFEDGGPFNPNDIFDFLSQFGAVKTISQPKITVLSGSEARLRVADTENFVSQVSQTIDNGQVSTSVNTSSVDTGFTLTIASSWDNSTVYADVDIALTNVTAIDNFPFASQGAGGNATTTTIQLPKTAERELTTQVRVRPGDSLLIAGLVSEGDSFDKSGPGFTKPIIPTSRTAETDNLELVFLLRPRVIVYTSPEDGDFSKEPQKGGRQGNSEMSPLDYDFAPFDFSSENGNDNSSAEVISSEIIDPGS